MGAVGDVDRFFVGGGWVEPASDQRTEVLNPATEEVIGMASVPTVEDARRAIVAARSAFDEGPWPHMKPAERASIVRRIGEILAARKRDIGELLIREVGSTVMLAKTFQCAWPIDLFGLAADWAEAFPWEEELPVQERPVPVRALAIREPVGVVAAMTPFNYPFFVNCLKVAPAIAMGNTIVLKPAPWTPLDAFEIARAAEEAGLPAGVLNVIGGGGPDVGQHVAGSPDVDMVSFTGSVAGGRAVGATAMGTVKKVQLELGGKSAAVVLDDADPTTVAWNLMNTCMIHAGQGCGATTRLLVPRGMHDVVVDAVVGACRSLSIGDPGADPGVFLGPLIREEHRARVEAHVRAGVNEGATVATGGRRPPEHPKGYFYEPTVLVGVRNEMRIAQEEIFGPVVCVIPYADEDEAVRIANDSILGLAGAVFGTDPERAMAVARRMRTGWIELGAVPPNFEGSWGGYRQSGLGREWRLGLDEFTELKNIAWLA